jgi:uncharacterized membrane protein
MSARSGPPHEPRKRRERREPITPEPTDVRLSESTRVETFSDAVFAIIITILVLELRVPPHEPGRLLAALSTMWASIGAFLLSFVRVSVFWLNHHGLFARVRRVDRTLLWLNLALLLNCMVIPFPTAILAQALRGGDPTDLRVAAVLYALLAAAQSGVWIPIYPHLRDHPALVEPGTDAALLYAQRFRPWIGVGLDVAAAFIALVSPVAMLVVWTFSIIFFAVTSDGMEARMARRRSRRAEEKRAAVSAPPGVHDDFRA